MNKKIIIIPLMFLGLMSCNNHVSSSISSISSSSSDSSSSLSSSSLSEESTLSKEDDKNIDIVILAGQSNAEGHTHVSELKRKVSPDIFRLYESKLTTKIKYDCDQSRNKSEWFENVKLGQGFNTSRFGPEIGMATTFENANLERDLYIYKYTVGATSIYNDWKSPKSGNQGRLYNNFIIDLVETLGGLEEEGYIPHVKAICWMQGEADSQNTTYTAKYQEYEKNLFEDINETISDYIDNESISIVDAYISDYSAWTNYKIINNAKKTNADNNSNHHIIDTISEGLQYNSEPVGGVDYYHYDSLSMIKLGKLFAESVINYCL